MRANTRNIRNEVVLPVAGGVGGGSVSRLSRDIMFTPAKYCQL